MSERLTERELAEIGAPHVQFEMVTRAGGQYSDLLRYPACRECRTPWPCDVVRLLVEVQANQAPCRNCGLRHGRRPGLVTRERGGA